MIELPEARTIAADLRREVLGKTIQSVSGNFTDHKFTFYYGNPDTYHAVSYTHLDVYKRQKQYRTVFNPCVITVHAPLHIS